MRHAFFFICGHFFGVASAQISKLWHQTMATFSNYATGVAAMRQVLFRFVSYACAQ